MLETNISVLMSVYHEKIEYFYKAVESIYNQDYKNWELIIINDGDIENDFEYKRCIDGFDDERIIYVCNEINKGMPSCLNQALKMSKGKYIARMDADDISLPSRLKNQFNYMEVHKNINVLGTYAISFGGIDEYLIDYNNYSRIYRQVLLLFQNSGLIHPTAMMRKSFLDEYSIQYDEHFKNAQDYKLWIECICHTAIKVLPKIEFLYRRHYNQISISGKKIQDEYRDEIRVLQLKKLNIMLIGDNKKLFLNFCDSNINVEQFPKLNELLNLIISNNLKDDIYNKHILKGMLYSKCLVLILKKRNNLSYFELIKYIFRYLRWESIVIYTYNKSISLYNKIRKVIFKKIIINMNKEF